METIGRVARRFGLSRSTLLYYDRIGLLCPRGRSASGYRLYGPADMERLKLIRTYRSAGLPLTDITALLDETDGDLSGALTQRLEQINTDVDGLRQQQRLILGILKNPEAQGRIGVMNRHTWTDLLRASGFSDEDMVKWHKDFERTAPDQHQAFLEFLCIPEREINVIRGW